MQGYERYLVKYGAVLHPAHGFLLRVKYQLCGMYGRLPGYTLQGQLYSCLCVQNAYFVSVAENKCGAHISAGFLGLSRQILHCVESRTSRRQSVNICKKSLQKFLRVD